MASARAPKRHGRLASLFGLGKVAGATISRLLDKVQREPEVLEGSHKRKTLDRALVTNIEEISCFVTLKLEKGGDEQWQVLSLAKATRELASQCASFRELLQWLYTARPCAPSCRWHLIVYFDETTPGDLLRLDNKRKTMGIYASVLEFGPAILRHEQAWIPLAVMRSIWYFLAPPLEMHTDCAWDGGRVRGWGL